MPFEHHVMTFWYWLFGDPLKIRFLDATTWTHIGFLLGALIILFLIAIGAPFVWFLMAAVKHGPSEAFYLVARAIYGGATDDLPRFSLPIVIWKGPCHFIGFLSHPAGAARREIARCTAAHSGQGRASFARRSEPLPASTDVRSTQLDGRLGGVAAILLVSSEQAFANSAGVR